MTVAPDWRTKHVRECSLRGVFEAIQQSSKL